MRLAVISDIHGNLTALEAVLMDLQSVGEVDLIWHLGDYVAFGPDGKHVIDRVREQITQLGEDKVKAIGGNTDRYLITGQRFNQPPAEDEEAFNKLHATRETINAALQWNFAQLTWEDYQWLTKTLGRELHVDVPGYGTVIGFHAVPGNDETFLDADTPDEEAADYLLDREGRLAIGGHTHKPTQREIGTWHMINPGSVGASFHAGKAEWALITFADGVANVDLRVVDYDTDALKASIMQSDFPLKEWAIKRLGLA